MENNESVEPESTINPSETIQNSPEKQFDETDLTESIKASLLSDIVETAPSEAENSEETPEESEGVQDSEVLSQSEEETTATDEEEPQEEIPQEEPDEDVDRGLPKGVKKRIDKLVAKRREAEDEIERLKSEVERLSQEAAKPAQIQQFGKNPYSNLESAEQVQKEIERAKQIRRWCEMNPEGGVVKDAQGNETEYSSEEVRNIKVKALDALEEHLPSQLNYINNANQVEKVVAKEYPWWKDRSSSERQIAEAFLKHFPEIKRFPDYKMVLGDYIRGVKTREASSKKGAPQRPTSQPRPSATPAAGRGANTKFTTSSGMEDLSSIIAQRFI